MKITFLGTGTSQGVPVIGCQCPVCTSVNPKDNRLRASVMIETRGSRFVIDTGPDFRQQMLREKVSNVDAVLLTHGHKDHIGGLDDVRAFNFLQKKPIDVYSRTDVQEMLKSEFGYAFARNKYPGVPQINLHTIDDEPFVINNVPIIPIHVMHFKLPVLGFRFADFTYITDASFIPSKEMEKIQGTRILVLNALRKQLHYSHFNLQQAVEIALEIKAKKTYLTHISHLMGLHDNINSELPKGIELAWDGLSVEF